MIIITTQLRLLLECTSKGTLGSLISEGCFKCTHWQAAERGVSDAIEVRTSCNQLRGELCGLASLDSKVCWVNVEALKVGRLFETLAE